MDTRAARTFLQVVEIGGFTKAAEVLGTSQPTITRLVGSIEREVGTRLLDRRQSGIAPTAAGRRFIAGLKPILHEFDALLEEVRGGNGQFEGDLRLGLPHSLRDIVARPFIQRFMAEAPAVGLSLQFGVSHEIEQALVFGQIDMGLIISPQTLIPLEVEPIASDPLYLLAGADSPFAGIGPHPVGWNQIGGIPLILPPRENQLRRRIEMEAERRGIKLEIAAEIGTVDVTMSLVMDGLGCTIHPGSLSRKERAAGQIIGAPLAREAAVWALAYSQHARRGRLTAASAALLTGIARDALGATQEMESE